MDAKSVLRLKREFRSLQALNHPHVVKLYDMGQSSDGWFLTMEYLDGTDLTTYLNAQPAVTLEVKPAGALAPSEPASPRLLRAFIQLARGIQTLHGAGMLHRDLKPNNVFVVDHRVVVLDFGLIRELSVAAVTVTEDGHVAGTPAYMAPEQIDANELTAASDWYAFGVMLYEAVSGLLPIDGPMMQHLRAKLETDPPPLDRLVPDVPRWLNGLCMALLRRAPGERPTGSEILAKLEAAQPLAAIPRTTTENLFQTENDTQRASRQLFGRADETERLWQALMQTEDGSSVVVHVRAPSGNGKSALVEDFLDRIEARTDNTRSSDALVLRSRCYELSRPRIEAQRAELPPLRFGVLHVLHMLAVMNDACWTGDYTWAAGHLNTAWPSFRGSPVERTAYMRTMSYEAHARFVLNQHVAAGRHADVGHAIAKDLRVLDKLPSASSAAAVLRFRARVACLSGHEQKAVTQQRASTAAYRTLEMAHEVARNEYALGRLLKGDEGSSLRSTAEQRMRELGVAQPMTDMHAHFPELCTSGKP
jgi:serine/threonine protein kinase